MQKSTSAAAMAAVFAVMASAGAYAQTKPVTPPPRQELDPAKRIPEAADPQQQSSASYGQQEAPAYARPAPATREEEGRGGFFVGVQGGKGEVWDGVRQTARSVNAGYRWQAGAVTLVGIEVAGGKLGSTTEDGWHFSAVDYGSIGANARFNFGSGSPVYGLVRGGYWAAEDDFGMDVDGGYFGVGLGVDFSRHFNMSLVYTNYVYFDHYYWDGGDLHYSISRADTLMLGAEVRF
ncbi:MAG: hypothetical protein GX856_01570 [Gammaproteobacteria bacterium]|jgi:hypothetical protein|nr:hypothetical protein [Gammaproteobacteria bacterium]